MSLITDMPRPCANSRSTPPPSPGASTISDSSSLEVEYAEMAFAARFITAVETLVENKLSKNAWKSHFLWLSSSAVYSPFVINYWVLDLRWILKIDQSLDPTFQSAMITKELAPNGWTAVPVDAGKIFQNGPYTNEPDYVDVNSIEFPSNDPIVSKTQQYAKVHLLKQTYHHSMRVYYWEENITSTRLSFEFQGGIQALDLLNSYGSTKDQAEAVCETIIRHQDFGTEGNITFLDQLIQLATIYDFGMHHIK
ncbi:uncharacterized protein FOBCDRAFT_136804 [Fusarium oxysporum Fo47]|uniref:Uncharacterized protein n=1 Tax=Fusarium oxysporum (strain Fo5176) TaxID=660025 RepID=F9GAF2_FUSOF|nr:uncharacterized protein FOBCDRAFT_136804 [Fusarium oxysporum Fo47]EGU73853.1 hypothetical protein FOXB_15634 [Fusarium oxysporum f. sp. conglutinans Fo5176]QKD55318.2 hypothetical protein FOBCDRAFT_136804 [Fusarium oxysporum Fo47]